METLDGRPLAGLSLQVEQVRAALPVPLPGPVPTPIPIPIKPPVVTTMLRGTTTIGYVITPSGAPAPTGAGVTLASGTLWVEASLFGTAFASVAGFAGIPFSAATMKATGSVTFGGGQIVLGSGATLSFAVTSAISPATGPTGDPIGADFLAATLTPFPQATVDLAPAGASVALTGAASAKLYGQSLALTPASGATPADLEFTTPHVSIPCKIAQAAFTVTQSTSPEVAMAGKAPIVGAGVVFPVLNSATPGALPAPGDAWGIVVVTGPGLSATITPLPGPLLLAGSSFALTPVRLVGLVANGAARARETYLLWAATPPPSPLPPTEPPLALPPSQIIFDVRPGSLVSFSADPNQEIRIAAGTLDAVLDRPLDGGGQRTPLKGPALLTRVHTAASITVDAGSPLGPLGNFTMALVAENAIIPVAAPNGFLLSGTLAQGRISGGLSIGFPVVAIVPTFPDPYVASYSINAGQGLAGSAAAVVTWTATTAPVLTINLIPPPSTAPAPAPGVPAPVTTTVPGPLLPVVGAAGTTANGFYLLDVSSNADQWGIVIAPAGATQFSFAGLQMQAPANDTIVFTVPGISWEPVVDTVIPGWLAAAAPDDGTPTAFLVQTGTQAPIVPAAALEQYRAAAGSQPTQALFTLPFGITANLIDPTTGVPGPTYKNPPVKFPGQGLTGARVLSITAANAPVDQAVIPGTAVTGFNSVPKAYGALVLGISEPSVADFWDQDFGSTGRKFMPIGRIDLSGYGTSLFSDWRDPVPTDPGIIRALFNVLLGRTAHEIITAQTWVLPWCIRLQRTITFDRSDGGEVVKHDTGWQAVGPGAFELLAGSLLAGPVQKLNNVRNIEFGTGSVTVPPGNAYTPCTFDADVSFASALQIAADGKNPAATSVGSAIRGYAQDKISIDPKTLSPSPPTAADIIALLQKVGRATGKTGCIARVGGGGAQQFSMTASSFGAAVAAGTTPMVQTALFGTPSLPKDGQWSVAKRPSTTTVPQPVDSQTPVPLTQGTTAGTTPPIGPGTYSPTCFRLLDPEDAQSANSPATFYGILQGTGTSKTFFEHPLINDAGNGLGFNNAPGLADAGALLGIPSVFPDIGSALQIPSNLGGLPLQGDGFNKTYTWGPPASPAPPDRALLDIAIVHLLLSYGGPGGPFQGNLVLNATPGAPNWSLTLSNLAFKANVDGFGPDPLVTISGGFQAGASTSPGFTNLQVDYGQALSSVKDLLTGLSELASQLGGSAELDVGFSGNTLSVQQGFTLPTIPLGFGEITDLGIDLGFSATIPSDLSFSVGIGSQQDPFQWVVSPLAGNGAIVLGVKGGGLDVYIEAGLGLGLSISVAVASGSASIIVSLSLEIGVSAITIAAALTGNAQVDVLGGLASASLTLTAAIKITIETVQKTADLAAQVSVGIHISICWVINVSFDGSWGFSEQISI